MARAHGVPKSFSQIPLKQLMLGRKMRGRTRRRTPRTPRSRSKGFPSHRGESNWWKCGSRSPLSFPPQNKQESMEGLRVSKLKEGQQRGKNTSSKGFGSMGKKTPFYRRGKIQPLCAQPAHERYYRSWSRYNRDSQYTCITLPGGTTGRPGGSTG